MKHVALCLTLAALPACSREAAPASSFEEGLLLLEDGKAAEAIAVFDRVLEDDPRDADALVNRGIAQQDLNRLDDAIADYDAAIEIDGASGVAYLNRGTARFAQGKTLEAIADYKQAIALDDEDAEAYRNRAVAWTRLELYDAAIIDYTQAMDLLEVETGLYRARADVFETIGNESAARIDRLVAETTEALASDPNDVKAMLRRGDAWSEMGEWADAVADYDAAIEAGAGAWPVYLARARAHFVLEADDQALADYTQAIELADANAEALAGRAFVHAYRNDYPNAIRDYEAALAADPAATDAQVGLANVFATCPDRQHRDGARARTLAKAACETTKWSDWYALDVYACACAEAGAFDEAAQWETKAIEFAPEAEREALQARLALFEAKQAYRSPGA